MAETVSSLVTALGRRIRDPNSLAHSSTNVTTLLSHIQRVVCAATGALKTSTAVSFTATNSHPIYDTTSTITGLVRIERVLYRNEDVLRSPWQQWLQQDPYWLRTPGSRPLRWDMIGRRLLAITPPIINSAETFTVIGTKVTTALVNSSDATELPDQHMPAILTIAEQLLLLRQRLLASVKPAVEHLQRALPLGIP
jgi:hypothetical protein